MHLLATSFVLIFIMQSNKCLELSLEEKVGQLLMVSVHAESINETTRALINDLHIGGIIYYSWANGLHSAEQVASLSVGLQNLAAEARSQIPLIIAIDHEGGRVHRFESGFTHFPPAFAYTLANDPVLTEQCGYAMGKELRTVGITMNLAPVIDVLSNVENPIIGTRAFGETPEMVIKHAGAFIKGLHQANCMTSLKHFPGHGDTNTDSHLALPVIHKTISNLTLCELAPFYALADKTDSIMTGHLMIPTFDSETCSTLSQPTLNLLRNQANFDGVIISDSLAMQGIQSLCTTLSDAAIQAVNAGCDIVLLGGRCLVGTALQEITYATIAQVHADLVTAVHNGSLSKERLDTAVSRILKLKKNYPPTSPHEQKTINTDKHHHISHAVATRALSTLKTSSHGLPKTIYESLEKNLTTLTEMYHENENTYLSQ